MNADMARAFALCSLSAKGKLNLGEIFLTRDDLEKKKSEDDIYFFNPLKNNNTNH